MRLCCSQVVGRILQMIFTMLSQQVLLLAGTQISDALLDVQTAGFQTVKGFATIDDVALINVEVSSSATLLFAVKRYCFIPSGPGSSRCLNHSCCAGLCCAVLWHHSSFFMVLVLEPALVSRSM